MSYPRPLCEESGEWDGWETKIGKMSLCVKRENLF